ncbi:uncharacterized protein FOMMEDRAFT_106444 [Fomitiporia mediterranea MF3/22]|uniref:uncharacterized protein n=1 Tax=Fomitiporia mediterranea (strain MF3/22) TaxID=694068 RepID=UPI00044077C6|nr:uncharacterized protein FOMMEDRAFT_106444 [Fomitiporia mediterranea MF3/22]EJD04034.1 hypothetical protein FOMMEDRAFT_106444 [Fomitiporia mediterranea MF3/22]
MLYDPSTSPALQAWLVKTLEPICDAEPDALATYIIALLKHDVPEHDLRQEVIKQLDEFFEDGASGFVDTLFAALRSKSYVPYTTSPGSFPASTEKARDAGIPIPLDALISPSSTSPTDRGTKRSHDGDDRETRGPPKGPRLSNEAYFARHSDANGHGQDWQRGPMDGGMPNGFPPQGPKVMLPKGVCRDYHLKGYCSRGVRCKYSHDEGAFSPNMSMPLNGGVMPFMNMYGGMPFPGAPVPPLAYDPNDSVMDMRPRAPYQRPIPTMPRGHQNRENDNGQAFPGHGELPVVQDLTPAGPREEPTAMDVTPTQNTNAPSTSADSNVPPDPTSLSSLQAFNSGPNGAAATQGPTQTNGRPQRGYRRGRGGRGGTFTGEHQAFGGNEQGRNSKTIVVEKIPDDKLSLGEVNNWFKRYGTVTNVAVDAPGKKALVSFSSHEEARAAWSAEEAVFNNRFVKIFWHRPMEGQGTAGARALEASASIVANMAAQENAPATVAPAEVPKPTAPPANKAPTPASSKLTALQEKQQLLDKQIAEQKELMGKLGSASAEEKKDIMARLRKLAAEMKTPSEDKTAQPPRPPRSRTTSEVPVDKERKAKELLDMELEAHAKTGEENSPVGGEETRESLQEKLEKLRAEASALGLSDTSSQPIYSSYRGGFRGRGRGRASFPSFRGAMRGGPPRGSMKLDNRPKALLVKGVATQDPEVVQAVRSWYETGGQLASLDVHDDESLIARFYSRAAAEQALAKGPNIPSAGNVKLSWHTETTGPKPVTGTQQGTQDKKSAATTEDRPPSPRPEEPTLEEVGWGNEDDDGMGMGGMF